MNPIKKVFTFVIIFCTGGIISDFVNFDLINNQNPNSITIASPKKQTEKNFVDSIIEIPTTKIGNFVGWSATTVCLLLTIYLMIDFKKNLILPVSMMRWLGKFNSTKTSEFTILNFSHQKVAETSLSELDFVTAKQFLFRFDQFLFSNGIGCDGASTYGHISRVRHGQLMFGASTRYGLLNFFSTKKSPFLTKANHEVFVSLIKKWNIVFEDDFYSELLYVFEVSFLSGLGFVFSEKVQDHCFRTLRNYFENKFHHKLEEFDQQEWEIFTSLLSCVVPPHLKNQFFKVVLKRKDCLINHSILHKIPKAASNPAIFDELLPTSV
ncbi:MAG: hypothetical protein ACRCXZ_02860 [Patescibacteria group bacterium]